MSTIVTHGDGARCAETVQEPEYHNLSIYTSSRDKGFLERIVNHVQGLARDRISRKGTKDLREEISTDIYTQDGDPYRTTLLIMINVMRQNVNRYSEKEILKISKLAMGPLRSRDK